MTMRKKARDKLYSCREDFITDLDQMIENSAKYNGVNSVLTETCRRMKQLAENRFAEKEEKMVRLEKAINPLLDDNDQVAFSYVLETVANKLKNITESWPFHKPVDKKKIKNYYDMIKQPMDLETLARNAKSHQYSSREEFVADVELMYSNSAMFNGEESQFTKKAAEIVESAKLELQDHEEQLNNLEQTLIATKEAALDAADSESIATGGDRDDVFSRPPSSAAHSNADDSFMDFDEGSQPGLLHSRAEHDLSMTPDPDDDDRYSDTEQNTSGGTGAAGGAEEEEPRPGPSQVPPAEDELVDENYDPSEFLFERFNNPVEPPPPSDRDSPVQDYEAHFAAPDSVAPPPQPRYTVMPSVRQPDDDTPGDIWF